MGFGLPALALLLAAGIGGYMLVGPRLAISKGRTIYAEHCAACHGANLEGAPNWQERLPSGRWPAPPHDATGHTWHHGDDLLFEMVKHGVASVIGPNHQSDMPAFASILSDDEIRAVLAYIKSTWPAEQLAYQELMSRPPAERLIQP